MADSKRRNKLQHYFGSFSMGLHKRDGATGDLYFKQCIS